MAAQYDLAQRILDTALDLAELRSWEVIRLHDVARAMNITLEQIRECYRQKDDLVEAWFDRADSAMLKDAAESDYLQRNGRERLHRSIMCWFNALSSHRRITGDMLLYKLELGHIHLQTFGIMRISRTVQWFLEAAHRDTTHMSRVLEEVAVTAIYLLAFIRWLQDGSPNSVRTAEFLDLRLRNVELLPGFIT